MATIDTCDTESRFSVASQCARARPHRRPTLPIPALLPRCLSLLTAGQEQGWRGAAHGRRRHRARRDEGKHRGPPDRDRRLHSRRLRAAEATLDGSTLTGSTLAAPYPERPPLLVPCTSTPCSSMPCFSAPRASARRATCACDLASSSRACMRAISRGELMRMIHVGMRVHACVITRASGARASGCERVQ